MIDIHNKLKYRNIKSIYNIKDILSNGNIILNNGIVEIYKVEPINIINSDQEFKLKIYSTYLSCIKNVKDIQIIAKTEKRNFNKQITFYKDRMNEVQSIELKNAISKYIEYLENQSEVENYLRKIYVVEKSETGSTVNDMKAFTEALKEIGINVKKICDLQEIIKILKASIMKENNGELYE